MGRSGPSCGSGPPPVRRRGIGQGQGLARDHVERRGHEVDDIDSDNDGLSDGVEVQLRNAGSETHQDSTPDDTTDLDAAREKLGERRWESDKPPWSSSADASVDSVTLLAGEPNAQPAFEQPAYEEPAYQEPAYEESTYADTMVAESSDTSSDGSSDSWA